MATSAVRDRLGRLAPMVFNVQGMPRIRQDGGVPAPQGWKSPLAPSTGRGHTVYTDEWRADMRHTIARDGIIAGLLGATAVAVWFLILDIIYRQAFATPAALGRGLLRILGPQGGEGMAVFVIAYTVFHFAAFIAVGFLVAVIVHWAEKEPTVLAGAMMLFVIFEIGFYGLSSALTELPFFGALGWAQVATGNLIAAIVMGAYMWRTHPQLGRELRHALGEAAGR